VAGEWDGETLWGLTNVLSLASSRDEGTANEFLYVLTYAEE
jgi:hypothetical protein